MAKSFWDSPLGQIALAVVILVWAAALIAVFLVLNYLIFHIPLSTR